MNGYVCAVCALVVCILAVVGFILEYKRNTVWRAITATVAFLSGIAAIISLILQLTGWSPLSKPSETIPTSETRGITSEPTAETPDEPPQESTSKPITYYRYREMEYTATTIPQMDGWELYDTTQEYSGFGEWSPWQYEYIDSSDMREVQTTTHYRSRDIIETTEYGPWSEWTFEPKSTLGTNEIEESDTWSWYGYYYFECPNCHAHMHGWDIICPTWAGGCGQAYIPENSWHEIHSETSWDDANLKDWYGTGKYYTHADGELCFQWNHTGEDRRYRYREYWVNQEFGEWSSYTDRSIEQTECNEVDQITAYRYRDRTVTTVYMFRRWGAWSDWSETKREPSDTVDVESVTY